MNFQSGLTIVKKQSKRPPKTEMLRARMDVETKEKFEAVLNILGISVTEAITLFAKQVILYNGIPIRLRIPSNSVSELTQSKPQG